MEEGFEEPTSRVLLVDNEIFTPCEYQREGDLESRVSKLVKFVFGPKVLYFDIRQRMASKAKRVNVTDGVLLELRKEGSRLWLVEYELSSHDLYSHVQPQIMGFIRSLRNPQTLRDVQLALYEEIRADEDKDKIFREFLGPTEDAFFFLDRVLHERSGVVIVIDEITPQLTEICEDFAPYAEVKVIEFKTYRKNGKEIYYFIPFGAEEEVVRVPKEKREYPEYRKSWKARLEWVNADTRSLVHELIKGLERELPGIIHVPKHRWYYFYKREPRRYQSLFAVLLLAKRKVDIRIRVDPTKFKDRLNLTKRYKGWFFKAKGEERGFSIKNPDQLNYALELIKQAYEHVEG
jgi:hypothetical protein